MGCFGCKQAAGYRKTQFSFHVVKIIPTCYITLRVHIINDLSTVPSLHSSLIKGCGNFLERVNVEIFFFCSYKKEHIMSGHYYLAIMEENKKKSLYFFLLPYNLIIMIWGSKKWVRNIFGQSVAEVKKSWERSTCKAPWGDNFSKWVLFTFRNLRFEYISNLKNCCMKTYMAYANKRHSIWRKLGLGNQGKNCLFLDTQIKWKYLSSV